ncbi:MAG: respiratory nitrate reductase subunit gamma [Deltaproteobacteria bacterium]|nr:respiratory nitrate reductase subunit gamma [Deltaproteobacteria bacterium]MBW2154569.1 respiratory nitrate reductase subunit gamma [Deltaproteobacteria bacterium]
MDTVVYIILVPMVYVAVGVFICGTAVRLFKMYREPKHPTTLQIFPETRPRWLWAVRDTFLFPTVLKENPLHWIFLMIFHVCFFLLIIGHMELIESFSVFQIIEHDVFLGGGYVGLLLSIALLFFLLKRFVSPYRELSVAEDYYLLILLFLTVVFGSEMDWARTWYGYEELSAEAYQEYLQSLLYLRPELPGAMTDSGHSFMMALHVFFANLFLMIFPFSKFMHSFFSYAMNKLRRG